MGRKKGKPKHQQPSPAPPMNKEGANTELESSGYAEIRNECEKALKQINKNNFPKALGILKKALGNLKKAFSNGGGEERLRPLSAALIHRTRGTCWVKESLNMEKEKERLRCLWNAVESMRKAAELSQNSVEYAHFYANLVYDMAGEGEEDYEEVIKECERALNIKNPVDPLKETWHEEKEKSSLEEEEVVEERIESVRRQLRRLMLKATISWISCWLKSNGVEFEVIRLGVDLVPIKWPSKVQNIRILSEIDKIKKATKTMEERRKQIEANVAVATLMQELKKPEVVGNENGGGGKEGNGKEFENEVAMTMLELKKIEAEKGNEKRKFGIDTRNLEEMERFKGFWDSMSLEMKREGFFKIRVSDLKGYFGSEDKNALEILNEALQFVEEKRTWRFWTCCQCKEKFEDEKSFEEHLKKHLWKLLPRLQAVLPEPGGKEYVKKILNCSWKPVDISSAVKLLGDCCQDSDSSAEPVVYSNDGWPECEDSERGPLLDRIHVLLKAFIKYECLADCHIKIIRQFALQEFENLASGSHLLKHGVDRTPVAICFLAAPTLQIIVKFLQTTYDLCELDRYSDKSGVLDNGSIPNQWDEVEEMIVLSDDATWLYLDESLLPLDCAPDATPAADASADTLLSWIFSGPLSRDQVQSWMCKKKEKVQQGVELFPAFQKVFYSTENLCEQKCGLYDALETMEDLCLEEGKKKENGIKVYLGLLGKQMDEIIENTELEQIKRILRDVKASIVNQSCDLESAEDDSISEDYWHQADTCMKGAFTRLKNLSFIESNKLDAQILLNRAEWRKWKRKFETVSANDYRLILSPLVKSYLRARLEDLAKEKSDSAIEALLAELELDSNSGVRGNDNLRTSQDKSKDKKKNRKEERDKKIKDSISKEHHLLGNVAREENSPPVTADGGHLDSDNLQPVNEDPLKLQEEELRRKTEHEEALEYQMRIENETKVKHLAVQQHKKSTTQSPKTMSGQMRNIDFNSIEQETLVKKSGFFNQPEETNIEPGKESQGLPHGEKTEDHIQAERQESSTRSSEGKNQLPEKESMQVGVGLKNDGGQNNCFLNVIIQSLWHLRRFRDEFLKRTEHAHVGAPCVICVLRDIFTELRTASTNMRREAVAPTALRKALSKLPNSKEFKEGDMNDAAEVYLEILRCLHDSAFTPGSGSVGNKDTGPLDCTNFECIAHSIFGLNKLRGMQCHQCGLASRSRNTSFNYHIAASAIRAEKVMHAESGFDKLLDLDKNEQPSCDHIDHIISNPPPVFTTVLEWESGRENAGYIAATLEALSTEIDLSIIYRGIGSQHKHKLVSVVNYHPWSHYCCFIYSHEHKRWVRYNDQEVEVIGSWTDVLTMCKRQHFQPQILFFEDAHLEDAMEKSDAASETLLAEEPDSKRGVQEGKNNLNSSQEKAEVNKKTKKKKRDQKIKAIIPKEYHLLGNVACEQASPRVTANGDHSDSDNLQAANENPLKLQKEELRWKTELETEKTKLEEALECQRRVENEAKGKESGHLNRSEGMHMESGKTCQDWRSAERTSLEVGDIGISTNGSSTDNANVGEVYSIDLKNDGGKSSWFPKVIIQSLWHLGPFQEFLRRSTYDHVQVGDPCVVCALYEIFTELSNASINMHRKAIAPTSLRMAISELYPHRNFFPEGQMINAFEFLEVIFDCLHRASTSCSRVALSEPVESAGPGPWVCANVECIAHSLFGMDVISQMDCNECKRETEGQKYTLFMHCTHAKTLLKMKAEHTESSFDDLLYRVMTRLFPCRICGKRNYIHYILSTPPHVFTTVVDWEEASESGDDIATTITAVSTEIDLSVLYRGLAPKHKHNLVSMVCYRSGRYHCFAYSHEYDLWIMFDDQTKMVIGSWNDVLTTCKRGHLQPQILFFLAEEFDFQVML